MHSLRYKGLMKTLRWGINVALLVEIGMALIAITLMVVAINSDEQLISGWTALTSENTIERTIQYNSQLKTATAATREINIQFSSKSAVYYLLKFIETIFTLSIVIFITVLLGKIFRSLYKDHPFSVVNAKRLKIIAVLIMAFTPYSIIQSLVYRNYISNHISIEGKTFTHSLFPGEILNNEIWLDFQMNLHYFLIGALLLIVAEIFRVGVWLKEDNEAIV